MVDFKTVSRVVQLCLDSLIVDVELEEKDCLLNLYELETREKSKGSDRTLFNMITIRLVEL